MSSSLHVEAYVRSFCSKGHQSGGRMSGDHDRVAYVLGLLCKGLQSGFHMPRGL